MSLRAIKIWICVAYLAAAASSVRAETPAWMACKLLSDYDTFAKQKTEAEKNGALCGTALSTRLAEIEKLNLAIKAMGTANESLNSSLQGAESARMAATRDAEAWKQRAMAVTGLRSFIYKKTSQECAVQAKALLETPDRQVTMRSSGVAVDIISSECASAFWCTSLTDKADNRLFFLTTNCPGGTNALQPHLGRLEAALQTN